MCDFWRRPALWAMFLSLILYPAAFAGRDADGILAAPAETESSLPSLVREKKCDECHRFSPSVSKDAGKGPDLFFAGNKFQKPWLIEYLQKPEVLRKTGYITDPGFLRESAVSPHTMLSPKEAGAVADYLMTLKLPDLSKAVDDEPLSKGSRARIRVLFERDYGCSACHEAINLAGKIRGGVSGPSLVDAGNRLTADWIFHWLKTPRTFLDKGRMPVFQLTDDATIEITKYIMTMKKENLK